MHVGKSPIFIIYRCNDSEHVFYHYVGATGPPLSVQTFFNANQSGPNSFHTTQNCVMLSCVMLHESVSWKCVMKCVMKCVINGERQSETHTFINTPLGYNDIL